MDNHETQELPAVDRPISTFAVAQARAFVRLTNYSRLRLSNWLQNPLCEPELTSLVSAVLGGKLLRLLDWPETVLAVGLIRGGLEANDAPIVAGMLARANIPCARVTSRRCDVFRNAVDGVDYLAATAGKLTR